MASVQRPLKVPADLLEAKRALVERQLAPASSKAPHAWFAQARVREAVQQSANQLHAVGVGHKLVQGKPTRTLCVRLYVTQKLPRHLLSGDSCLPEHIDGIPTDVVEAAPAYFAASPKCSLRKLREQRPAQGGISGAHESIQAGTLAARCVSRRAGEGADRFVLGNCHTLADFGLAPLGSAILQPSTNDGGTVNVNRLASLQRFVPIFEASTSSNLVDAAIARLDSVDSMSSGICTLGAIQGSADPTLGIVVHKHGRTTGYTAGIIDDPSIDVFIPLHRQDPTRLTQFLDQVRIRPRPGQFVFAQPGDSGALVLAKDDNAAVGLLFACPDNGSFAYANPIAAVLEALEIDFE
ncbi:hypothetical protein QTI66_29465 [Variovorax sp. J22R133]|uniref:hypothetical protein n=1 Tax=Variovorax brevis TaxID=3053503 RepID=UPI002576D411|nr:hypothetical protein [Variovorax sp. J22R133]MDM0116291.1 hypothetical protein [Variovorax sp. J22R133]